MAFLDALNKTLKHEGGYVNDPQDKGGETYQGISRRAHPNWGGWGLLDSITNKKWNDVFPLLNSQVADFYYKEYWLKNNLNLIVSNQLASLLFDWRVNSGGANKEVQKVLNNEFGFNLVIDGLYGSKTISALNSVNAFDLIDRINAARFNYYLMGAERGWFDAKFLQGLINRADSYSLAGVSLGKSQAKT